MVFASTLKTDHLAVFVRSINDNKPIGKIKIRSSFRRCLPAQKARYIKYLNDNNYCDLDLGGRLCNFEDLGIQQAADLFNANITRLLNEFFPVITITRPNHDPPFITPQI